MAGYAARQSTYVDGDVIDAADSNDEFDAILAAFGSTSGHNHDGTAGEGSRVTVVGTADDNVTFGSALTPDANNTIDIGTSGAQFKDLYIDGTAYLDAIDFNGTAISSTAAELNIMDGGTSASSTTVVDADRVVFNDGGTMKQVAVTDLAAYFDDEITAMPNLVTTAATTVGALDSGSISTGFGNIDNGASNITSGGLLKLDVDADADDLTGDSATGRLTIGAGEDLNLYHGGTNSYIVNDTGDLILDTADDIVLDADGGDVFFKDAGTQYAALTNSSGNLIIKSGSTTAITFDGANATFAGTVTIGSAGISEAELEILDGATVTTAELNIMDGDTSASSTTVVDADRVVFNDDGTMKQVAVTDLAAYFDDEITAMPNLVTTAATTVGALDSGSITSGFGSIDTGSSTITTTGLISGGSLDIDDVLINGTTIGHTDDTDLITLANGVATVAGEISVTTLDIGGTNVTSTAAELNIMDGGTAASSTTVADADRVVYNDDGTMKQVAVTDLDTYISATTKTLTNKTLTTPTITTPVVNAGLQLKNGSTSAGFLEFFEDSDNGTNKATLIGPASTADVTLTLPSATGTIATADDATALAIALG